MECGAECHDGLRIDFIGRMVCSEWRIFLFWSTAYRYLRYAGGVVIDIETVKIMGVVLDVNLIVTPGQPIPHHGPIVLVPDLLVLHGPTGF